MQYEFKPIETAPVGQNASDQILCRFWYTPHKDSDHGYWVYFVAYPFGANTTSPNHTKPEQWCELPA